MSRRGQLTLFVGASEARAPASAHNLVVDCFAGGGGASTGIERALGRPVDLAINHNPRAIALHARNHPHTDHYVEDVWQVDPLQVTQGRPVDVLWASPDCRHFSKAKGGKPASPRVRSLAWVVVRWARRVAPRVICLENVEEFLGWGPLDANGLPDKTRTGSTFALWKSHLERLGYRVEHKLLRACDYGAPTYRRRLFVVARRDGLPIVWPTPTHGPGRLPFRTAADCIDWSVPCPSIFRRSAPLADKTLARIARGLKRFVFDAPRPFIVPLTHHGSRAVPSVDEPFRTITGANRGEHALVPTLIQTGYGEREGQAPRSLDLHKPLGTVVAGGAKHALVLAFLAKHYGGNNNGSGQALTEPASTVTTIDHHALVTATLKPDDADTTSSLAAFLIKYFGTGTGAACGEPMHTITTKDRFALVVVDGKEHRLVDIGMRMLTPRELARAQGFEDSYSLDATCFGERVSKTDQIKMIGNSVCPQLAEALVRANCVVDVGHAAA